MDYKINYRACTRFGSSEVRRIIIEAETMLDAMAMVQIVEMDGSEEPIDLIEYLSCTEFHQQRYVSVFHGTELVQKQSGSVGVKY